jgi:hypothetical protein
MSQTQSCRKDDQFSIKKPVSLYIGLWSNSLWFIAFRPKQQILIVAISHENSTADATDSGQPKHELLVISKNSGAELLQASPLTLS